MVSTPASVARFVRGLQRMASPGLMVLPVRAHRPDLRAVIAIIVISPIRLGTRERVRRYSLEQRQGPGLQSRKASGWAVFRQRQCQSDERPIALERSDRPGQQCRTHCFLKWSY